jgi:very-short-patch-repair endonuclease
MQSKLRSIFDYLFSHVDQFRRENDSEYASENLTFDLLEKIRTKYPHLSHIKALRNYPMRYLIYDTSALSEREAKYALHSATHIDFLIINRVTKEPLLAIETDGYSYHNEQTEQYNRDRMKDYILANYGLPLLRLSTVGHSEEQRIVDALGTYK